MYDTQGQRPSQRAGRDGSVMAGTHSLLCMCSLLAGSDGSSLPQSLQDWSQCSLQPEKGSGANGIPRNTISLPWQLPWEARRNSSPFQEFCEWYLIPWPVSRLRRCQSRLGWRVAMFLLVADWGSHHLTFLRFCWNSLSPAWVRGQSKKNEQGSELSRPDLPAGVEFSDSQCPQILSFSMT